MRFLAGHADEAVADGVIEVGGEWAFIRVVGRVSCKPSTWRGYPSHNIPAACLKCRACASRSECVVHFAGNFLQMIVCLCQAWTSPPNKGLENAIFTIGFESYKWFLENCLIHLLQCLCFWNYGKTKNTYLSSRNHLPNKKASC